MEHEALLLQWKAKIDRRMEKNPPQSPLYEYHETNEKGEYEPQVYDMYNGVGWTRSFLNGAVAYLYYHYKEEKYLDYLRKAVPVYEEYLYSHLKEAHHDDGFRMSLQLVALYKLTGEEAIRRLALVAADQFVKRFKLRPGIIQGFFSSNDPLKAQTIADDMMNIALLMWAYRETGNAFYKDVFTSHISVIMRDVKREDFSFRHSFQWSAVTGEPVGELNYCGYAIGSTWSRGQSWVLYGLVNALAATEDEGTYLPLIDGLLNMLFSHMQEYPVLKWDLNCLGNKTDLYDTSATVIILAALYKLQTLSVKGKLGAMAASYTEKAEEIRACLLRDFLAAPEKENLLDGGQCGDHMCGCVWGDYFAIEALMRKLHGKALPDFWV